MSTTTFPPQSAEFSFGSRGTSDRRQSAIDQKDDKEAESNVVMGGDTSTYGELSDDNQEDTSLTQKLKVQGDVGLQTLQELEDFVKHTNEIAEAHKQKLAAVDEEEAKQAKIVAESDRIRDKLVASIDQIASEAASMKSTATPDPVEEVEVDDDDDDDATFSEMEDLYKLNPKVFGEMPTKEFRAKVKQLRALEKQISASETAVLRIEVALNELNTMITKKQIVSDESLDEIVMAVAAGLKKDTPEDVAVIKKEFQAVPESDWFDMSPRRAMEGYRALLRRYVDEVTETKNNITRLRQSFFDQYVTH